MRYKKSIILWLSTFIFTMNLLPIYSAVKADSSITTSNNAFRIEMKTNYIYFTNNQYIPSGFISGKIYSNTPIIALELCDLTDTLEENILPYLTKESKNIYDFKISISKVIHMFYSNNNISVGQYDLAVFCDNKEGQHIEKRFKLHVYSKPENSNPIHPSINETYLIYYKEPNIVKIDKSSKFLKKEADKVYNYCYVEDLKHRYSKSYPTAACLPASYKILTNSSINPFVNENNIIFYINIKALKDLNLIKIEHINNNIINIIFSDGVKINVDRTSNRITLLYNSYEKNIPTRNNIIIQDNDMFISIKFVNKISEQKILVLYDNIDPFTARTIILLVGFVFLLAMWAIASVLRYR